MNALSRSRSDSSTTQQRASREEVLRGLRSPQKELPCKFFYDRIGSELF